MREIRDTDEQEITTRPRRRVPGRVPAWWWWRKQVGAGRTRGEWRGTTEMKCVKKIPHRIQLLYKLIILRSHREIRMRGKRSSVYAAGNSTLSGQGHF